MKKPTKEKISKLLFDSLSEEQKEQMQTVLKRNDIILEPPIIKVGKCPEDKIWNCVMVDIQLIEGSYKD